MINPIAARELRWGAVTTPRALGLLFVGCFLIFLMAAAVVFVYAQNLRWSQSRVEFWLYMQMGAILLITPILGCSMMTKEYEQETADSLRSTLLHPRSVFLGKAIAAALPVLVCLLASLCACAVVFPVVGGRTDLILAGVGTLMVTALLAYALTLFASVCTKRTALALVLSFVLIALAFYLVFGVATYCYGMLYADLRRPSFWEQRADQEFIALLSPILTYHFSRRTSRATYCTVHWAASIVIHTTIAVALLFVSAGLFKRKWRGGSIRQRRLGSGM